MAESEDYKVLNVSETAFNELQKIIKLPSFKNINDLNNKHLFILSMALGFKNNKFSEITKKHSGGYCRVESLSEEDKSIIKAIAVNQKKDVNILGNQKEQYQIAEAYANGGIAILKEIVSESGDFFVNLSKEF